MGNHTPSSTTRSRIGVAIELWPCIVRRERELRVRAVIARALEVDGKVGVCKFFASDPRVMTFNERAAWGKVRSKLS